MFGSYKLQCFSSFPVCDNNDIVNIDYVLGWNKTLPYTRNPWRRPQDYKAYLLTNITVVAVKSDRLVIILNNVKPSSNNVKPSSNNVKPSSNNVKPSSNNVKPSSNNVKPSSNNVKPSSNNVKPFKACSLWRILRVSKCGTVWWKDYNGCVSAGGDYPLSPLKQHGFHQFMFPLTEKKTCKSLHRFRSHGSR